MKIAHLIPWLNIGGSERSVLDLCRMGSGQHCMVAAQSGPFRPVVESAGINVRVPVTMDELIAHLSDADLVHVHWAGYMEDVVVAVVRAARPVVFSLRWPAVLPELPGSVICNSIRVHHMQRANRDRNFLILNGIDAGLYPPPASRLAGPIRIIRVCRAKRCEEYFWPAMLQILAEFPDAELQIVGGQPFRAGRVEGLGYRLDTPGLLAAAHIFAYTPRPDEGSLDKVVMEAMATGLPCALSDVPCVTDVARHGVTALLSPFEDIQGFADNLRQLVRDSALRESLGLRASKLIREQFDIRQRMPLYEEVWARTLAENRLPKQLPEWRRRFRLS